MAAARALALGCAMDQRAALERADRIAQHMRVRGLVDEARTSCLALQCTSYWSVCRTLCWDLWKHIAFWAMPVLG